MGETLKPPPEALTTGETLKPPPEALTTRETPKPPPEAPDDERVLGARLRRRGADL
jgi:hypothetical protein